MAQPFVIRPAHLEDFDAMSPLWRQLDDFHHKQDPVRFPKTGDRRPRDLSFLTELIDRPDRALLVAQEQPVDEEDAHLIGLCTIYVRTLPAGPVFPARVIFEIDDIVVDEPARRHGVGRALIREAEAWSRRHGAGEIVLNVYDFNGQARALYEQLGFMAERTRMTRALV